MARRASGSGDKDAVNESSIVPDKFFVEEVRVSFSPYFFFPFKLSYFLLLFFVFVFDSYMFLSDMISWCFFNANNICIGVRKLELSMERVL